MKLSRLFWKILLPAFLQRLLGIPRSSLYGEARWMGAFERRRFLSRRHDGLVLSPRRRLSAAESCKNLVLMAPTGSGKTTRYVIPNLLELSGSAVVTDPSGEIYRATSGHLRRRGFAIQVLQPAAPGESLRFNPLHYFRGDTELRRLATVLAGTTGSGDQDAFWRIGATDALHFGLQALTALPNTVDHTLANLRRLLNVLSAVEAEADAFMARSLKGEAFGEYRAFMGQEEKVKAAHLSTARAALDLRSDAEVRWFSGDNTADIAALRERPTVIYLIVPEHKVRYYGVILNLFYTACFEHCVRCPAGAGVLPVYFFLDEFGNLGRIENFAAVITTLRKRRCSVSIILQEKAQLDALYGRDAQTIFAGGCGHKLYFSGLDLDTCRHLEATLGQQTEYDGLAEREARKVAIPLLRHDEIRMLPPDRAILISGGRRPLRLKMPPYFRVGQWRRQTALPAVPHPTPRSGATRERNGAVSTDGRPYFLQPAAGGE
jgi:type IV secretion system protein VirD4